MIHGFLKNQFAAGLKIYLDEFQYGNAVTDDLWDALSKVNFEFIAGMLYWWMVFTLDEYFKDNVLYHTRNKS